MKKLILQELGPISSCVMLSGAIRDLHTCHPYSFQTDVRVATICNSIFDHNPFITKIKGEDGQLIHLHGHFINYAPYGAYHFSEAAALELEEALNIRIVYKKGYGDIYIGQEDEELFEKDSTKPATEYWVVNPVCESFFATKKWPTYRYEQVVDHFRGKILFAQIGPLNENPLIPGVVDYRGKTLRETIRLIWGSCGVLTCVTYPMCIAAAIKPKKAFKGGVLPCVVIAGAREPNTWSAFLGQQFLHNCGMMKCADSKGCWKGSLSEDDPRILLNKGVCVDVIRYKGESFAKCLSSISVREVVAAIDKYLI